MSDPAILAIFAFGYVASGLVLLRLSLMGVSPSMKLVSIRSRRE
jgi:hypothetical protein